MDPPVKAPPKYDLYSDAFRAATHETYSRMREDDPVFCQPGLDGGLAPDR